MTPEENNIPDPDKSDSELEEVDDSASERFGLKSPETAWIRGRIDIEFIEAVDSGLDTDAFDPRDREGFSEAWPAGLIEVAANHKLNTWRPSFPLTYSWTPEDAIAGARAAYRAAGRDRFITLTFPPDADVLDIAKEIRELPEVARASAVPKLSPPSTPFHEPLVGRNDQVTDIICWANGCLQNQWYIFRCGIDRAWNVATGKGVTIADIDWGFNPNHQDLELRIGLTQNMLPVSISQTVVANGNRLDHGTAVLGLAGARVNALGMAGTAYEADLWAIQAGSESVIDPACWVSAIDFVRDTPSNGRKIIILEIQTASCGNIEMDVTINKAICDAIAAGVVVCVPAGNGSPSLDAGLGDDGNPIPPTGSILVGATKFDPATNIRANSNGGARIVVYAPGDRDHDLTCALLRNKYRNKFGGTSGAVAKVAGVAALMLEVNSQLTHHDVRDILAQSNIPVVDDSGQQVGVLLDAKQAVCEALRRAGGSCPPDSND
jgi:hypothetical protein